MDKTIHSNICSSRNLYSNLEYRWQCKFPYFLLIFAIS